MADSSNEGESYNYSVFVGSEKFHGVPNVVAGRIFGP
jgi:hypothetical protein